VVIRHPSTMLHGHSVLTGWLFYYVNTLQMEAFSDIVCVEFR